MCVCVLVDAASDICLPYSFLLRIVTAGQPVHPSSYRNWLLTDTLQAGLQLKDPTGSLACCPRATVVATVMHLERMCPVVVVKEFLLFHRYGRVLSVMLLDGRGFSHDQKQSPPHTDTYTDAGIMHDISDTLNLSL